MVRGRTGRRAAARNQQSGGLLVSPRETPSAGKEARKDTGAEKCVSRLGTFFCIAVVRGRTGRRAAARNQQSGGLLVSPRETPSAGKEARKDAGERGGAALARRIVGRLIKTLESFFRKPAGRALQKRQKRRAAFCDAARPGKFLF